MPMALKLVAAGVTALGAVASPSCSESSALSCISDRGLQADVAGVGVELLQTGAVRSLSAASGSASPTTAKGSDRELVLQHIPFNFGHTVEKVAGFGSYIFSGEKAMTSYLSAEGLMEIMPSTAGRWNVLSKAKRPDDTLAWGHMNPDLFAKSTVTGCPLYFTPGKYWPKDVAEAYFGDKTIFGMLRDPYERLVAMFRGNMKGYGAMNSTKFKTCDLNGAIKEFLKGHIAANNTYESLCTFVPQAEYFDGPYGISYAVDNRLFPDSANEMFNEYGYTNLHVATEDILHVTGCPKVWAGDLDCEAKSLVKQVYARDFELLCSKFGYCDDNANVCIKGVELMCPPDLPAKEATGTHCS